jgi:hypothetical protein
MSEQSTEHPRTPAYIRYATISGFVALVLTVFFAAYFAFACGGWAPPPALGVVPAWMTLILLSAAVKLSQVMATAAAKPAERQIALLRAELREAMGKVTDDLLQKAHDAGQWKGIAETLREGMSGPENSADVVPFGNRRRPGG